MKISIISDDLTHDCLKHELDLNVITKWNYRVLLKWCKPSFLFVESSWSGRNDSWKYKIASYPDHPSRNNLQLLKVVNYAKDLGIPTVFWNKEDDVHFDRFINSAKHFDHIFTVDVNSVKKYKSIVDSKVTVNTLMFAVQPKTHFFSGFNFKFNRANFVGSYSHHIHDKRRKWQDMFFQAASLSELGITAIDRNSKRKSSNFRYPVLKDLIVLPAVKHNDTAQIYKDYLVSLNINTIENSETMFSRRLIEILACGGIAVTNPSSAVTKHFKDFCLQVNSGEEAFELFSRLKYGPSNLDLEKAEAGAKYIIKNHTWSHRLEEIAKLIGLN